MNSEAILSIISEPVHGSQFYNRTTLRALLDRVQEICEGLEIDENSDPEKIISIVNNYVKYNVSLKDSYFDAFCERSPKFDRDELPYRTAYGALVKKEAMCAGYTEAVRVLLSQYGIQSQTVLTKLPGKNKRLLHYVAIAEYEKDGETKYAVLDPERQANCEKKGMDYERYQANMIYAIPSPIFTDDVVGETGLGMQAEEYLAHEDILRVTGTEHISIIVNEIKRRAAQKNNDRSENNGEVNRD